jgi:hypothetical protein
MLALRLTATEDGCLLATPPRVSVKGKLQYAHRLVWELRYGEIPPGQRVAQTCGNKKCVRHLALVQHRPPPRPRTSYCEHALTPDNIRVDSRGCNTCATCRRLRFARRRARLRELRAAT